MSVDLSLFANLKDKDLSKEGCMVLEGRLVIEKAIQAGVQLESLLCSEEAADAWRARAAGQYPVTPLPHDKLVALLGYKFHHGAVALARRPTLAGIEALQRMPDWPDTPDKPDTPDNAKAAWLCIWEVTDPSNVGALIRSAAGFGAKGVLLGPRCADPYYRKAIRTSMGNCFTVPLYNCDQEGLRLLSDHGFALTAATLGPRAVSLHTFTPSYPLILVVGNEGYGLPAPVLDLCAHEVKIPMANDIDSFNVVVAASICMYALFAPPSYKTPAEP